MTKDVYFCLQRRGFKLGTVDSSQIPSQADSLDNWQQGKAVFLPQACADALLQQKNNIQQSQTLYKAILAKQECDALLDLAPYQKRIAEHFEPLGSSFNEGDKQEIETVFFDAVSASNNDRIIAEDLWLKISWLSFCEDDNSLRFRLSFGVDLEEDVAADKNRQHYAALLCDALFPESCVITDNQPLKQSISQILDSTFLTNHDFAFVERIIYFNAPNGGAYLHHDRERGHCGVVYAQISGSTFWLALSKNELLAKIADFIQHCKKNQKQSWPDSINPKMQTELADLISSNTLSAELDSFANSNLIHLINETEEFIQFLIRKGYGKRLVAGDVLLLPQASENCCWHTVFTLGEEAGEALSFAVRDAIT